MFIGKHIFYHTLSCSETASFSLEITICFYLGKLVAALSSLALAKGFLWASAAYAASWAGLDTCHNPVPRHLPICLSVWYICSLVLAVDPGTPYRPPAVLELNPPFSTRVITCSQIDLSWWGWRRKGSSLICQLYYSRLTMIWTDVRTTPPRMTNKAGYTDPFSKS
jgi:hypothetical protein